MVDHAWLIIEHVLKGQVKWSLGKRKWFMKFSLVDRDPKDRAFRSGSQDSLFANEGFSSSYYDGPFCKVNMSSTPWQRDLRGCIAQRQKWLFARCTHFFSKVNWRICQHIWCTFLFFISGGERRTCRSQMDQIEVGPFEVPGKSAPDDSGKK